MRNFELLNSLVISNRQDLICALITIIFLLLVITTILYFVLSGLWYIIDNENFKFFYTELFLIILLFVFCIFISYVACQNNINRTRRINNNQSSEEFKKSIYILSFSIYL